MKKISFVIFVTLLLNGAIATNSAFSGGGYWYFNEGSGLVAQDSSMNGNHWTLNGAVAWTVGKSGAALSFNGGSDRVLVPDAPSLDITDQITIAAWIKPKTADTQYIVKKGRIRSTDGYELSLSSTGKVFVRFNQNSSGDAFKVMSASNYPTGGATWMHVAATYDGLDIKLYINGVLEAVQPATLFIGANNNALSIGAQDEGSRPFLGVVDEVHLYSIPLTLEQIQALVAAGQPPGPLPVPNISVAPLNYNFGNVAAGHVSPPTQVTLSNSGAAALHVSNMVLSDVSNFTLNANGGSRPCGTTSPTVPAGQNCTVSVQFRPSSAGPFGSTLRVDSDDPDTPSASVSLSGNGVAAPIPNISVAPPNYNFGNVAAGSVSPAAAVTVSNSGTADLHVSNMVLSDASNFTLDVNGGSRPCGTGSPTVPAGQNCTVSVRFKPSSAGPFGSTLRVDSDDPDTPSASVSLSGNGVAARVTTETAGIWTFDEGSGLVTQDSSGNGNHGTLNGAVAWTVGKSGSALSFNGGSDRVLVPDAPSLDITDQITIAAWIKPKTADTQYIVKKSRQGSTDGYELSLSSTGKVFVRFNQRSSGDAFKVMSASNYPTGGATWMHVAATYDGLDIKLYINGVLEAVQPATLFIGANNNALSIGAQDDGYRPFLGVVDEVHLYSIPLTLEQIQALVAAGQPPGPLPLPNISVPPLNYNFGNVAAGHVSPPTQ